MRVTKRDFLKLFAGGTGVTAAALAAGKTIEERAPRPLTADDIRKTTAALRTPPRVGATKFPAWDPAICYDIVDRTLYDRLRFAPGSTVSATLQMFIAPLGQTCPYTGRLKTTAYTNMSQAGILAAPSLFWIRRVHIVLLPDVDRDAVRVASEYGWSLWMMQKRYQDGQVATDAQVATRANVKDELYPAGPLAPTRQSLELDASNGLFIPQQAYFHAELQSGREHTLAEDGTGLDFLIALEGVEARGIC